METRPWPDKLQQSVQTTIANMDNGNNLLDSTTNNTIQDNTNNNEDKCNRNFQLQQDVQAAISEKGRQKIQSILELVNTLPPLEKLLLYLKLPTEQSTNADPLRQSLNPLGSRSEISQTITWIQTHLEEDKELSLQKKGVYDDYVAFCERNTIKPLSTADFGKVMKQVYPEVRPRRLGTRGKSKYCYSGLRSRIKLAAPNLPDLQDKYLSTEPHFSQHELMTAAWMIIKEWSENKFSVEFKNIIKLAYYLVKEYSVGIGTDAANQIFSANVKEASYSHLNKHKETTLQLQRKLQQKNEGKEIKRKQSPRMDSKSRKKFKASPASTSCSTSPVAASESKSSPQSQEHSPVCDDSINLHTLPDFNCFQRPPNSSEPQLNDLSQQAQGEYPIGKVAIPRITNPKQPSSPKRTKQVKCKAIQPKPELCDTPYNPKQTLTARNIRSQQELNKRQRFRKKDSPTLLIPEESSTLFSRERLISIGQVNKEDLDEYLGTSNSQEPEEELMQYFSNSNEDQDTTKKISQLRQLLEKSRIAQSVSDGIIKAPISGVNTTKTNLKVLKSAIPPNLPNLQSAKRRVSFDTQVHEETVPASPNTRRQNINFIPISPSSPNERQSKCSSTNASPFVSPRNTPVARARGNAHTYVTNFTSNKLNNQQFQSIKLNKPEKLTKPNLEIRISENSEDKQFYKTQLTNLPMSAPPSPKTNYIYGKNYPNFHPQIQNINLNDPLSPEVSQLFVNNVHSGNNESNFRSQSVPLNQFFNTFTFGNEQNLMPSEFNDIDFNNENINVTKIIDDIDNSSLDMLNMNLNQNELENASNVQLNENIANLPIESDLICIQNSHNNNLRGLGRSQSIDVEGNQDYSDIKFPSRSVPSTPLPFHGALDLENLNKNLESIHDKIAKSYPSTPITQQTFNYNSGQDYLLNGQPIKDKLVDVNFMTCDDNKDSIFEAYNETDLIDNKNFNFDGPIPEGNCYGANKQNINPVLNQGVVDDFFKVVPE